MSDNNKGLGEKLMEAGVSSMKAGADEIKTSVSTAVGQITGQPEKTDQELQQIAAQDKESSGKRINEIQQELERQKIKRFQEVSSWQTTSSQTQETHQAKQHTPSSPLTHAADSRPRKQPEPIRQAVGKSELGRNFKG